MIKYFRVGFLSLLLVGFLASCNSDDNDVRQQARQSIETTAVTPQQPAASPVAKPAQPVQPAVPVGPVTSMSFEETEFDFGNVTDGDKVAHTYKFKNTGNEPLILSNAKGTCGCTVPTWPREPIAPGASGELIVEFNSKNKKGKRTQKVTVTANTDPPQSFIYLKGEVLAAEGAATVN